MNNWFRKKKCTEAMQKQKKNYRKDEFIEWKHDVIQSSFHFRRRMCSLFMQCERQKPLANDSENYFV